MRDTTEGFVCGIFVMIVLYIMFYITGYYQLNYFFVMIVCFVPIIVIIEHVDQKGKSEPYPFLLDECIHTDADRCFRDGWRAGHFNGKERMRWTIRGAVIIFSCMWAIFMLLW